LSGNAVPVETPLNLLIEQLAGAHTALDVMEHGKCVGTVTAQSIVERLRG
jgi:glycine betaine/proline transport system ATP-binding protein